MKELETDVEDYLVRVSYRQKPLGGLLGIGQELDRHLLVLIK